MDTEQTFGEQRDFIYSTAIMFTILIFSICILAVFYAIKLNELHIYKSKYNSSIRYIEDGLPTDGKQEILRAVLEVIDEEAKKSK
jgi:hypothetical protein